MPSDIEIDAAGISAIAYGSAVIDLARDGTTLPPPSLPLAAVPAARGRRRRACRSKSAGGRFVCAANADADAILWVGDGEALLDFTATEVEIRPGTAAPAARPVSRSRRARAPLRDFPRPGHRGRRRALAPDRRRGRPGPGAGQHRIAPQGGGRRRRERLSCAAIPAGRAGAGRRSACSAAGRRWSWARRRPGTGVMAPATLTASS